MKYYSVYARYKNTNKNEALEFFDTFKEAKNYTLKCKVSPKFTDFDLFGIDVFDHKKELYTHYYILDDKTDIFVLNY